MPAYLGPVGGLVELSAARAVQVPTSRPTALSTTLGGTVKAQVGQRAHRRWSVSLPPATSSRDLAALQAFVEGEFGIGPWWWIDRWSQVTNVLPGDVSTLQTPWMNTVPGGPVSLPDGTRAGRSLVATDPAQTLYQTDRSGAILRVPVVPLTVVTASVWLSSADASLVVLLRNAAGATVGTPSAARGNPGWGRVAVTFTVPSTAVDMNLRVVGGGSLTRPAITWTPGLVDFHTGQGADQVVVTTSTQTPVLASEVAQMGAMSYEVQEVG